MTDNFPSYTYRDLDGMVRAMKIAVGIFIAVAVVETALEFSQLSLLGKVAAGESISMEEAEASDGRVAIAVIAYYVALLGVFIVFLRWLYLANKNASALSGRLLDFSPAWLVGCFFVPILNFWKPYQGVKEVIEESSTVERGGRLRDGAFTLLTIWWICRIGLLIAARFSYVGRSADTLEGITNGVILSICTSVVEIVAQILALLLVMRITALQQDRHEANIAAATESEPLLVGETPAVAPSIG